MSHVVVLKQSVKDIGALKNACPKMGLVFHEGRKRFHSYTDGDCDHAIGVKGKKGAYEIGVKKVGDEYKLVFDPYNGGNGLIDAAGKDLSKLMMYYNKEAAWSEIQCLAAAEGLSVCETVENGELVVKLM